MDVRYNGKLPSHEIPQHDYYDCQLCARDSWCEEYIPYMRTCCQYHSNIDLHSRKIRRLNFEITKPSDENKPELDGSIVKNTLRAVQAVVDNDLSFLKCFLTNYPSHINSSLPYDPKYTYDHTGANFTLLQIATMEDNPEAVELILQFQPDTGKKPYPLLLACHRLNRLQYDFPSESRKCRNERIRDVIRLLLAHGADPNILYYKRSSSDAPQTPLTNCVLAQSVSAVKMLLDRGAKPLPDVCTDNFSAHTSTASSVKSLTNPGKKVELKATGDDLPMNDEQLSEQEMAQITQQIFLTYTSVDNYYVDIFLRMLIGYGLDIDAYYGDLKLIHCACIPPSSSSGVRVLLEQGADINAPDKNGEFTALHQLLVSQPEYMSPEFVEKLLSFGADFHIEGRIPVENSNLMPPKLSYKFKMIHPRIFKKRQSYTAYDLLPPEFPRDILFREPKKKKKVTKPLNISHNTPVKVPVADNNQEGAASIGHPYSGLPGQQQYPVPSFPGHASDVDSRPPPFNPGMDNVHDVDDLPPSYESLFSPMNKSPMPAKKKSWLPWKRK